LLTAVAFVTGCNAQDPTPRSTERAQAQSVAPMQKDAEKQYLHRMADHHQGAIAMSKMAERMASHPELKEMAKKAIAKQTDEINQMSGWASDWYGVTLQPHLTPDMKPMMARLSSLSPEKFDQEFLKEMIKHHRMGIDMAKPMVEHAPHAEVRSLSQTIVDDQSKEIKEMSARLQEWYGTE
jgi:uncharacterized protein (DUF305 family)